MSREYRHDEEAARAKIAALEADLREHETKLSKLLFSQTPNTAFAAMRARAEQKGPPDREPVIVGLLVGIALALFCWGPLRSGVVVASMIGALVFVALWLIVAAVRGIDARPSSSPNRRPEEAAAMAALIADREARIESLQSQITSERAACEDLRKRIEEAELLLSEDEPVKNRESSR